MKKQEKFEKLKKEEEFETYKRYKINKRSLAEIKQRKIFLCALKATINPFYEDDKARKEKYNKEIKKINREIERLTILIEKDLKILEVKTLAFYINLDPEYIAYADYEALGRYMKNVKPGSPYEPFQFY